LSGRARDDLEPGLRILPYRRQVTIVYRVERDRVLILNIFKAGQDYEAIIRRRGDKP
jgi:toxin ParE1/3/4